MGLEDIAMMRAVHGSTVLYPSDATSAAYLVREMADRAGVVYMRTTRGVYPVLYSPDEIFPVGGSKVVRSSPDDQVTLIGAGVTLHNCLDAAGQLGRDGIRARVIDLYSLKPIDTATLVAAAEATSDRLVVVEDHYAEGESGAPCSRPSTTWVTPCASCTWPSAIYLDQGLAKSSWRRRGSPLGVSSRPSVSSWPDDMRAPSLVSTSLATSSLFLGCGIRTSDARLFDV